VATGLLLAVSARSYKNKSLRLLSNSSRFWICKKELMVMRLTQSLVTESFEQALRKNRVFL